MDGIEITRFQIETCPADKEEVWAEYPFYILHFVFRGSGFFDGNRIEAGHMFLVRPNELATWKPDPSDPWEYGYVNGKGSTFEEMLTKMGFDGFSELPFRFPRQTEALFKLARYPVDSPYHINLFMAICQLQIMSPPEEIPFEIKVSEELEFFDDPKTLWEGGKGLPIQYVDGYGVGYSSLNDQVIFRALDFGDKGVNKMVIGFSNGGNDATLAVYVDKKGRTPAATFTIPNTGGYESVWAEEFETDIDITGGLHDIIIEFTNSNSGSFHFIRFYRSQIRTVTSDNADPKNAPLIHLQNAERYINSRFGRTSASTCADQCHLSEGYLNSLFKKHHKQSLQAFIISRRIEYASSLLRYSKMTIKEIAAMTGYRDPLQFSQAFRVRTGKSPRAFRKEALAEVREEKPDGQDEQI